MLYDHYSIFLAKRGGEWRWPNFTPAELSCPCCGEFYYFPAAFDALQRYRDAVGYPVILNSGHRCAIHNAHVGGAPRSEHKLRIAFDLPIGNEDRRVLYELAKNAGFRTFGFYNTFLHVDMRPGRRWFGVGARSKWNF